MNALHEFYVYFSVHRRSILIIAQRDATQSSLFIILQVHSTCFVCQPHPSPGVHKTVTTASGTVQLPPSNVAMLVWPRSREVAATEIMTSTGGGQWHSAQLLQFSPNGCSLDETFQQFTVRCGFGSCEIRVCFISKEATKFERQLCARKMNLGHEE